MQRRWNGGCGTGTGRRARACSARQDDGRVAVETPPGCTGVASTVWLAPPSKPRGATFRDRRPPVTPIVVVDASAVVDLLLRNALGERVRRVLLDAQLQTVAHLDAEVFSVLARLHRAGELAADAVAARLRLLATLDMSRMPITERLLAAAWSLRENVSARDALYVALARTLRTGLLTTDARLARAVPDVAIPLTVT